MSTPQTSFAEFERGYIQAVKLHRMELMHKKFTGKLLKQLEIDARSKKVEVSGGLDFEKANTGIVSYQEVKGSGMASPFFHKNDYEMQFHTHVAYHIDMNLASCHPSPADMGNVALFYPGVILWETPRGKVQWMLLRSLHKDFVSPIGFEKVYDKARKNASGSNTSKAFVKQWRTMLNKSGMDFSIIKPGESWVWLPVDNTPEKKNKAVSVSRQASSSPWIIVEIHNPSQSNYPKWKRPMGDFYQTKAEAQGSLRLLKEGNITIRNNPDIKVMNFDEYLDLPFKENETPNLAPFNETQFKNREKLKNLRRATGLGTWFFGTFASQVKPIGFKACINCKHSKYTGSLCIKFPKFHALVSQIEVCDYWQGEP